jgi:ABC-type dipeptide/oligopeptide/nickel transport system ATPase component
LADTLIERGRALGSNLIAIRPREVVGLVGESGFGQSR